MQDFRSNVLLGILVLIVTGCSAPKEGRLSELEQELQANTARMASLESELHEAKQAHEQAEEELAEQAKQLAAAQLAASEAKARADQEPNEAAPGAAASGKSLDLLPPDAQAGECYARVSIPPKFDTVTEQVLKQEASTRIETIPPKYAWVEERVLIEPEHEEVVGYEPATYKTQTERIEVKPASYRLEVVQAVYEPVTEEVLVREARKVWKPSQGRIYGNALKDASGELITQTDARTGELMCLVEDPAQYRTVTKRILKTPAATRRVEMPAEYKTVTKKMIDQPPKPIVKAIPAKYEIVRMRKLVEPAQERVIDIPAEYTIVTKSVQVSEGRLTWMPVLCEANVTQAKVTEVQQALKTAGHDPGKIDGVLGARTMASIEAYQRAHDLAHGGLTLQTLAKLGVDY